METVMTNLLAILPESLMVVLASVVLLVDLFLKKEQKHWNGYIALVGVGLIAIVTMTIYKAGSSITAFSGMFTLDPFAVFFKILIFSILVLSILLSINYLKVENINYGEYYAMMLFAATGMLLMASASDLVTVYLGIEMMALSIYVLTGFLRRRLSSVEAAIKYFVLGLFSSGVLLYGISLVYLDVQQTNLHAIAEHLKTGQPSIILLTGMILILVGLGFKVAAAPFHMWTPDAYHGAPTSVTAFMSVGAKAAAFAVTARVLLEAFGPVTADWKSILIVLAIITLAVGNIAAIAQSNIKRMLAYSSIAHAGYAMIALIAGGEEGTASLLFYLFVYAFMNLGALAVVIMMRQGNVLGDEINDLSGLARKNPLAAFSMLVFMFSLAGIPPFAGFVGKFYIFMAAIKANLVWLAVVGVLFSAISAYYYLRVVMVMYMKEPDPEKKLVTSPSLTYVVLLTMVVTVLLGLFPDFLIQLARLSIL